MSRFQLALNVTDLEAAVAVYSELLATPPAKMRPGYANFAVSDPPMKLVLVESDGAGGTLNHLGVEVESAAQVEAASARLRGASLPTAGEHVDCCFAEQDKVWVEDPDGVRWEVYTVLEDTEVAGNLGGCRSTPGDAAATCCAS